MPKCKACKIRMKQREGDQPRCAFESGECGDNWNCATVELIRDICYEGQELKPGVQYQYCDDQKYATINVSNLEISGHPLALWVSWYKSRGETNAIWLLFDDEPPRKPTEQECLIIADGYGHGRELTAIFCGSRYWLDREPIEVVIRELISKGVRTLIHGGCRGVDSLAGAVGKKYGFKVIEVPADWDAHGKAAGPIRNQKMLDDYQPDLVVAFTKDISQSRGTADMIRRASLAGVPVRIEGSESN